MLIEFSVENFMSFREEARLSLVASASKEHEDTHLVRSDLRGEESRLLRSAVIYGANAAGKSNFLIALGLMREMVVKSNQEIEVLPVEPFRFDPGCAGKPTILEIIFVVDQVRYQYGFAATEQRIVKEWLFAWPRGRPQTWFTRDKETWKLGSKLSGDKDVWRRATRANALFLSTAAALNSAQLMPIYQWFQNAFRAFPAGGFSNSFSIKCCHSDQKSEILNFMNTADIAISDIKIIEKDITPDMLPDTMSQELKEDFIRSQAGKWQEISTIHDTGYWPPSKLEFGAESLGTQRLFSLSGPWIDTLKNGYVLAIDELHDSLHPNLLRFLIDLFHDPNKNTNSAQLIFTTHDTSILNQEVFRRDQVWLCERNVRQESTLTPLTDFRPRKRHENLEKAYLSGRYGAVPVLQ
ncbi:MAG: ATP-binding protein [Chloroflexi bacterium]|nr:ATP-binding protein [Chloroflexota bacterium]